MAERWIEPMSVSPPQQYLPGYLLGGGSGGGSEGAAGSGGGAGEKDLHHPSTPHSPSSPLFPHSTFYPHSPSALSSPATPDYGNRGRKSRGGTDGPPTASLFDDLPMARVTVTPPTPKVANASSILNTTLDSSKIEEEETSPGFWVVVFGFPPSHASQVLAIFMQLGRVMEQSFPNNGNWFFIKYYSRMDVRKALAYKEKIICGNIMIGVAERKGGSQASETLNRTGAIDESLKSPPPMSSSRLASPLSPATPSRIRHLGPIHTENSITDPHLTPKKETSIVTKAMDLLFGW